MGTSSSSGNIEIFNPGRMYMNILRPVMEDVLSEEMVKKDDEMGGNIPGGNFLGGNFPEGIFQGGVWWVGIFRVGEFS